MRSLYGPVQPGSASGEHAALGCFALASPSRTMLSLPMRAAPHVVAPHCCCPPTQDGLDRRVLPVRRCCMRCSCAHSPPACVAPCAPLPLLRGCCWIGGPHAVQRAVRCAALPGAATRPGPRAPPALPAVPQPAGAPHLPPHLAVHRDGCGPDHPAHPLPGQVSLVPAGAAPHRLPAGREQPGAAGAGGKGRGAVRLRRDQPELRWVARSGTDAEKAKATCSRRRCRGAGAGRARVRGVRCNGKPAAARPCGLPSSSTWRHVRGGSRGSTLPRCRRTCGVPHAPLRPCRLPQRPRSGRWLLWRCTDAAARAGGRVLQSHVRGGVNPCHRQVPAR